MVTRIQETREQMLRRLAEKARVEGVKLYRDERDGRHYASSVSNPGHMYYLTAVSCTCPGFASHGHCKHHSALLVALGWASDEPTPEPEPVTCTSCKGQGSTASTELFHGRRLDILVTCWHCRGTGHEQIAA